MIKNTCKFKGGCVQPAQLPRLGLPAHSNPAGEPSLRLRQPRENIRHGGCAPDEHRQAGMRFKQRETIENLCKLLVCQLLNGMPHQYTAEYLRLHAVLFSQ